MTEEISIMAHRLQGSMVVALAGLMSTAAHAELACAFDPGAAVASPSSVAASVPDAFRKPGARTVRMTIGVGYFAEPESGDDMTPDRQRAAQLRNAVRQFDVAKFDSLLSGDRVDDARRLADAGVLEAAFGAGLLPMVEHILVIDPSALVSQDASMRARELAIVAQRMASTTRSSIRGFIISPESSLSLMELLLAAGADPTKTEPPYDPPLVNVASATPSATTMQAARLLLAKGAAAGATDSRGVSALAHAAGNDNRAMLELMEASQSLPQDALDHAMAWAPIEERSAALDFLLSRGARVADPLSNSVNPPTPIAYLAAKRYAQYGEDRLMHRLVDAGLDPKTDGASGGVILSAIAGDSGLLSAMLDRGADPNSLNEGGTTPLLYALAHPTTDTPQSVSLLLARGADPQRGYLGITPLALTGQLPPSIVDELLAHGAWPPAATSDEATRAKHIGPLGNLILSGSDAAALRFAREPYPIASEDCAAAYYAAHAGNAAVLEALLDRGLVLLEPMKGDNERLLLETVERGDADTVRVLLAKAHVDPNASTPFEPHAGIACCGAFGIVPYFGWSGGTTALMTAVKGRNAEIVKLLLESGASVNRRDFNGRSAQDFVHTRDAATLLERYGAKGRMLPAPTLRDAGA
ncbi:MAG: ankyrin repeat domain-containing protein [Proteobacteria bacterium]|nr:ankyrin repeat domain-containing protein [Pseudomonadota bacterium]